MNTDNEPNISLYGDGSGEDFPVLKAFQQYIDAEQAKARKRLVTVSILFASILVCVIGIFSFLVISANERSQAVNDRLIEFAMKEANRKVDEARSAAVQEATVKTMTETLQQLQKQLSAQNLRAEGFANAKLDIPASKPVVDTVAAERRREEEVKLQRAIALLKAEKAKLDQEKEKLHQAELERYRRENYPEYYAKKESKESSSSTDSRKTSSDSRKLLKELSEELDLDDDDAIQYFNEDEDNLTIPVKVKGKRADWRVPLD